MAVRLNVDPNEDLDQIINNIKAQNSKDVTLVLPPETRALQELNNFYALRTAARSSNINLSFSGGNKTIRGLAKLLGFSVADKEGDEVGGEFEPAVPATPPSANRGFGLPEGFVIAGAPQQQQPTVPIAPTIQNDVPPPPQRTSAQDFFNEMNNFDPGIPSQRIQPPPMKNGNGNGRANNNTLAGPGDELITRDSMENVPDFFSSADGGDRGANRQPPRPEFDFGNNGGTMTFEQAARNGLIPGENLGNGYVPSSLDDNPPDGLSDDMDDPSIPADGDTAASRFQTGRRGGRRGVRDVAAPRRGGGRQPKAEKTPRVAVASTGPTLRDRVDRILNPVQPTQGGITMIAPTLTPEAQRMRSNQRRRTNSLIWFVIILAILIIGGLIWFILRGNGGGSQDTPQPIALTVPLKTSPVQNTVRLTLDTSGTNVSGVTGTPTTAAATTDAAAAAGTPGAASPVVTTPAEARLAVKTVSTGEIKKSGDGAASGSREVPDKAANGPVSFTNGGASAKGYGAGQVIYTVNGVNYRLVQGVTIPAGNPFTGALGRASGSVVADKPGTAGNLPQATSRLLSDSLGVQIGPIAGGSNRVEKFVTQADLDALKKQLADAATGDVNNALQYDQASQGALVVKSNPPACTFRKNVNEVVDETGKFQGTCTTSLDAVIYNKQQLTDAVKTQLVKDTANYKLDPNSKVELSGEPKIEDANGQRQIVVTATGRQIPVLDSEAFKNAIAGKTKTDILATVLPTYPQVDPTLFNEALSKIQADTLPVANQLDLQMLPDYQTVQTADPNLTPSGTPGLPQGGSSLPRTPVTTAKP